MKIFMRDIAREVAAKHLVPVKEMLGRSHKRPLVRARWEAYYRCRHEAHQSLGAIASLFGRDHTTVWYGLRRYEGLTPQEAKPWHTPTPPRRRVTP